MATYSRRERHVKHVEYVVALGSSMGEFNKAYNAAKAELCRAKGPEAADWDNWAVVDSDDGHVIIRLTIESSQDAP